MLLQIPRPCRLLFVTDLFPGENIEARWRPRRTPKLIWYERMPHFKMGFTPGTGKGTKRILRTHRISACDENTLRQGY
jgi:hypothetical protein